MDDNVVSVAISLGLYVGLPALVLGIGWFAGHMSEVEHEKSLRERENSLADIEISDLRSPPGFSGSEGPCELVSGEAVVASDAFKSWVFRLKNIVGGESNCLRCPPRRNARCRPRCSRARGRWPSCAAAPRGARARRAA